MLVDSQLMLFNYYVWLDYPVLDIGRFLISRPPLEHNHKENLEKYRFWTNIAEMAVLKAIRISLMES